MFCQFLQPGLEFPGHPGVDDVVEALPGLRVGEDQLGHLGPVEGAVRVENILPHRGGAAPARRASPTATASLAAASASRTFAPSSRNIRATVLFPDPAPPVMAILSMCSYQRSAVSFQQKNKVRKRPKNVAAAHPIS